MTISSHKRLRFESAQANLVEVFVAAANRIQSSDLPATAEIVILALFQEQHAMRGIFASAISERGVSDDLRDDVTKDLTRFEEMREELRDVIKAWRVRVGQGA